MTTASNISHHHYIMLNQTDWLRNSYKPSEGILESVWNLVKISFLPYWIYPRPQGIQHQPEGLWDAEQEQSSQEMKHCSALQ